MKVFVAGATGVLGRRLLQQFRSHGHSVLALVHSAVGEELVKSLGAEERSGDLFDSESLVKASKGADVFVHAATAIPKKNRTKPSDWVMNDRIRREGTRALIQAAGKNRGKVFLMQSIAWVNQPSDGSPFDEDSPIRLNRILQSAADGEKIAIEGGKSLSFEVAVIRCGNFYSADSFHTRQFGSYLKGRRMAIVNGGKAKWSLLHVDDAAGAFVAATEARRSGLWNVVDDYPVSVEEFFSYFAERLGSRPPRHLPGWLFRLVVGKYAKDFFSTSMETSSRRFKRDVGWAPQFPTYKEGLDDVIRSWKSEDYLGLGESTIG